MRKRSRSFKIPMIVITVFVMAIINLNFINQTMTPVLLNYAQVQGVNFSTLIINKAIAETLLASLDQKKLVLIEKNAKGGIASITFNTYQLNKLLSDTTLMVSNNLKAIENGRIDLIQSDLSYLNIPLSLLKKGIIYEIPFGIVSNNVMLNSLGPKIPVKFNLIGDVKGQVISEVKSYGINNALIELRISITVSSQVVIPLASTVNQVVNNIPVAIEAISGELPEHYIGTQQVVGDKVVFILDESEAL